MPSWQGRRYFSPAMVNHGIPKEDSPIAVMLNEHQLGRGHIKSLSSAFEEFKDGNKLAINNIISSSMNYVELVCRLAPTVGFEVNNQVAINPSAFDTVHLHHVYSNASEGLCILRSHTRPDLQPIRPLVGSPVWPLARR